MSDRQGNYIISVPKEDAVLVFSFIGFQTKEVKARTVNRIDVALEPNARQLNEVVKCKDTPMLDYRNESAPKANGQGARYSTLSQPIVALGYEDRQQFNTEE